MKSNRFVFSVLGPIFLFIGVFTLFPLVYGLVISFFDYYPLAKTNPFVGIDNYVGIFKDKTYGIAIRNTLTFVFITVALNIVITLVLAQLVTMLHSRKFKAFFRMIFFLPCVAALAASAQMWGGRIYHTRTGLVNLLRGMMGMKAINILGNPELVMIGIIIFTLWADFGYNTVLFSAALEGIPSDYDEAARIDGASAWQRFIHIRVPLIQRTFVFVSIMTLISHFQMFVQFWTLATRGGANDSAQVLTSYTFQVGFVEDNMGYASAVAVTLFAIIMVVTMVQRRFTRVDWGY